MRCIQSSPSKPRLLLVSSRAIEQQAMAFHVGPKPVRVRRMPERPFGSVRSKDDAKQLGHGVGPVVVFRKREGRELIHASRTCQRRGTSRAGGRSGRCGLAEDKEHFDAKPGRVAKVKAKESVMWWNACAFSGARRYSISTTS
jgi:hypothetical protein